MLTWGPVAVWGEVRTVPLDSTYCSTGLLATPGLRVGRTTRHSLIVKPSQVLVFSSNELACE